jgi:hypothetical protein
MIKVFKATAFVIAICMQTEQTEAVDMVSSFGAGSSILGAIDFIWPSNNPTDSGTLDDSADPPAADNT